MAARLATAMLVFLVGLCLAGEASAESWKRCQQMSRQIEHFYDVVKTAEERENPFWESSTRSHIAHLEKRRLKQCPRFMVRQEQIAAQVQHEKNVQTMKKLMKVAAEAAMKYYTGGLY